MEAKAEGTIIAGLDVIDVIRVVAKKKNKFIALTLQEIEVIDGMTPEMYELIRKQILDGFNDYTRSLSRSLFGDVEVPIYDGG